MAGVSNGNIDISLTEDNINKFELI